MKGTSAIQPPLASPSPYGEGRFALTMASQGQLSGKVVLFTADRKVTLAQCACQLATSDFQSQSICHSQTCLPQNTHTSPHNFHLCRSENSIRFPRKIKKCWREHQAKSCLKTAWHGHREKKTSFFLHDKACDKVWRRSRCRRWKFTVGVHGHG